MMNGYRCDSCGQYLKDSDGLLCEKCLRNIRVRVQKGRRLDALLTGKEEKQEEIWE